MYRIHAESKTCRERLSGMIKQVLTPVINYLDSDYFPEGAESVRQMPKRVEPGRCVPFLFLHLSCLAVIWVGTSETAVIVCAALFVVRMFAVTAFYHRYFSHRSFETGRLGQFIFACIGTTAAQRGPLWWAAHHRRHHREADREDDVHSPTAQGFLWSHIGWITCSANMPTDYDSVKDLAKYPELRWLNRFDWAPPVILGLSLYLAGELLRIYMPALHTSGWQLVIWGFFVSTVLLFHATCSINSFAHMFGYRTYRTPDNSRNNPLLVLITMGEGWHNNHHRFQGSVRQGFFWWEVDLTYLGLRVMEKFGMISGLRAVPQSVLIEGAKRFKTEGIKADD
jgi:stearoyl-CoA desaturase (delta-9 desaturase)